MSPASRLAHPRCVYLFGTFLLFVGVCSAASNKNTPPPHSWRDALIVNEDNSHFFSSRPPEEMTQAGLEALVDRYAGSAVTHLFFSPNAMRTSFRSKTRDAIWDAVDGVEPTARWPQNAKRLDRAGLDPYAIWIDRCRSQGISPWLSMRMNDVHSVDEPESFMHSEFWRAHPNFRRVPGGSVVPWVNQALDYAHPEVRAYQMALVHELLERYDPDGIELDWMRFGHHLTPGREAAQGIVLTRFIEEVRAVAGQWAQKRGHPVFVGVRVPAHPEAAKGLGMDAVTWAKSGLIDLIVAGPFWTTSDFDIPLERWHAALGESAARVATIPGLEYNSRAWPAGRSVANDLPTARGFAATSYRRGAQNLYLFNWMDNETRPVSEADYATLLKNGLTVKALRGQPRRHPVTYRDTVPAGFPNGVQLPVEGPTGGRFRVDIGSRENLTTAWLVVGLAKREGVEASAFQARINGQPAAVAERLEGAALLPNTGRTLRFLITQDSLRDGENEIRLLQTEGQAAQQIVWVELRFNLD